MKHLFFSCLLTGFSWACLAQSSLSPLVPSGSLIEAGIKLHDEEKYDEALAKYQLVSRNDTNYAWVLSEIALTYTSLKQYDKAIAAAQEGLQRPSDYALDLSLKLANAYDEAGQSLKAVAVYDSALTRFPHTYQLHYERGIALTRLKRTAEAIQSFQRAIDASYFHASSHYSLGQLCVDNGYPVQGMLSMMTFLILQPESDRAVSALVFLEKAVTEEKKLMESSQAVGITDAFPEITKLIRSRLALQDQYEFKSKMQYKIVKQMQLLMEKLPSNSQSTDFWARSYGSLYRRLWDAGLFEPFTFYTMASIDEKAAQKYKKDDKDVRRFREWASEEFSQANANKKDILNGKEAVCFHRYYPGGRLHYKAQYYDKKKNAVSGYVETYFQTGGLRSRGTYAADEKKIGEWNYYYPSGAISQVERFTTPGIDFTYQSFYLNGNPKEEGRYVAGKLNGTLVYYTQPGAKIFEGGYQNDVKHGRVQTFYPHQTLKSEVSYVNGLQNGPYRNYHPNGVLSEEGNFRNGKQHGPYVAYAKNGKPTVQGGMSNDQMEGEWKWFHTNGKPEKSGIYRAGKQEGAWKVFFPDGTLSQEFNQVNGQMEGIGKVYDTDGKLHFENDYKAGRIRKYRYFDKQGKVLAEETARDNRLHWVPRYPSGGIQQEGELVDGEPEGKSKAYHEAGYLLSESFYRNGKLEGSEKTYYPEGTVSAEQQYRQGQLDGLYRGFHPNGKLAAQGWFSAGERQGEWLGYYINGQLKEKTYYLNNEMDGYQEYYHPDGKKYLQTVYREGLLEQHTQFDTLDKVLHQVLIKQGSGPVEWKHLNGKTSLRSVYRFGEKEGEETVFYPSGKPKYRHSYRYQVLHGPSQAYYPNGKLRSALTYYLGDLDSSYQTYDAMGRLEVSCTYKDGEKEGPIRWFYPSGQTETEGHMKEDEREGYFTYYAEDGTPQVRFLYVRGLMRSYAYPNAAGQWNADIVLPDGSGKIKAFYPNGKPSFEGEMRKGQRQGVRRFFYPNGQLCSETPFVNGMVHGEIKEYYANGRLKRTEQQLYDLQHGLCQEFRENGSLARETNYLLDLQHGWEREFDSARKVVAQRKYVYDEPYE
jgi:antitoxin component YwqK of YwqJK toxin-antitoxin module